VVLGSREWPLYCWLSGVTLKSLWNRQFSVGFPLQFAGIMLAEARDTFTTFWTRYESRKQRMLTRPERVSVTIKWGMNDATHPRATAALHFADTTLSSWHDIHATTLDNSISTYRDNVASANSPAVGRVDQLMFSYSFHPRGPG
jgi:hypothetical protein